MPLSFRTALRESVIAALLLLGSVRPGFGQEVAKEQLTVALSAPGKPGSLEVKLVRGGIRVTGYGGKDVVIDAAARANKPTSAGSPANPGSAAGLKRISTTHSLILTAEEKNNRVEITTEPWKGPVDLTIRVPRNFSLKVGTVNDGDITIENVAGELEITNANGDITLSQIAGSAVANTVNGDIKATFSSITAGAPMAFSTLNGKVDVTLPANTSVALKMKSDRGEVYSDFDVALSKSQPKVTRSSQNGLNRISTDNWTYGKLNNGGAEVMMQTFNGDIFLRKAK